MAGNIREIIRIEEQRNPGKTKVLKDLEALMNHVDRLQQKGSLSPFIPTEPKGQHLNTLRAKRTRLIEKAAETYRDPYDPDIVTDFQQKILDANGIIINKYFDVTPCPFNREQLHKGIAVFVPGQEELTYAEIGAIVPKTNDTYAMSLMDIKTKSAWYLVESNIFADPNNKPEEGNDLSARAYIIAAFNKKILGGELFDSKGPSWTWVPGSYHPQNKYQDQMPAATFGDDSLLTMMSCSPLAKSIDIRYRQTTRIEV